MKKDIISKQFVAYKPHDYGDSTKHWKGGSYTDSRGYVMVYHPKHPNSRFNHYICEHRVIMENNIGRYLTKDEEVHHKNGIKDDNRIENLELLSKTHHRSIQRKGIHIDYSGRLCFECGSDKTYIHKATPPSHATPYPNWFKHPKDKSKWCCAKCWKRLRSK